MVSSLFLYVLSLCVFSVGNPRCGAEGTKNAYKAGVSYAIKTIAAKAPKTTMYVDAAHGGWLGWTHSLSDYLDVVADLDVVDKVRKTHSYTHIDSCTTP